MTSPRPKPVRPATANPSARPDDDLDSASPEQIDLDHRQALIENRLEDGESRYEEPEADPMELVVGMVPLYNPTPYSLSIEGAGEFFTLIPCSATLVNETAARLAVGSDFAESWSLPLYKLGVRRLRQPLTKYKGVAGASTYGSLEAWVRVRNQEIKAEAEQAYANAHNLIPDISGLGAIVRAAQVDDSPS